MLGRSVLFVDDSALARATATRLFAERGIVVTVAATTREAAEVDPTSIAAALLDIELDDGLGTDLAERLRTSAPRLPIAFLTAGNQEPVLDAARSFGPVFLKSSEVEDAVSWIAGLVDAANGGHG
jgi:CheY-like chemotaxis protein